MNTYRLWPSTMNKGKSIGEVLKLQQNCRVNLLWQRSSALQECKVEPHVIMASYLLPAKVHAWFPCNATAPELAQIWPRRRRYQEARSQVIKKLSPEELQARRDKDFCFNCKFLIMRFTVRRRDVELKGKSTNGRNKRRLFFLLFLSWRRRY